MNIFLTIGLCLAWIFISLFVLVTFIASIIALIQDIIEKDFYDIGYHIIVFLSMSVLSLIIIGSWIQILS